MRQPETINLEFRLSAVVDRQNGVTSSAQVAEVGGMTIRLIQHRCGERLIGTTVNVLNMAGGMAGLDFGVGPEWDAFAVKRTVYLPVSPVQLLKPREN